MENNAVIKNGVGNISQAELAAMKEQMNHKAFVRRRTKTALRLAANIMVGAVILLQLLYAVSIHSCRQMSYTLDLNLIPKKLTFKILLMHSNVPLLRFIGNSFFVASLITIGQIITCSLAAFAFSFWILQGKRILFMVVMATMMKPR